MNDRKSLTPPEEQAAPLLPVPIAPRRTVEILAATKARTDQQLLESWIASLRSKHSQRNCRTTGQRFLHLLGKAGCTLRTAAVEDVRSALEVLVATKRGRGADAGERLAPSSTRQVILRCKSLLTYGHKLGYTPFNAGVPIKVDPMVRNLAKRIVGETDIALLIRSSIKERDFLMMIIGYTAALRVAELVALNAGDVIVGKERRAQLHVVGKGGIEREVLLPADLSARLFAFIAGKPPSGPVFCSSKKHREHERLTTRGANFLIKRLAKDARITERISVHWLRHAHASHALDHGAALHEVQATLGHANISTTSAYLHARPGRSTADNLDASIWRDRGSN